MSVTAKIFQKLTTLFLYIISLILLITGCVLFTGSSVYFGMGLLVFGGLLFIVALFQTFINNIGNQISNISIMNEIPYKNRRTNENVDVKQISQRCYDYIYDSRGPVPVLREAMYEIYQNGQLIETITESQFIEKYYTTYK